MRDNDFHFSLMIFLRRSAPALMSSWLTGLSVTGVSATFGPSTYAAHSFSNAAISSSSL